MTMRKAISVMVLSLVATIGAVYLYGQQARQEPAPAAQRPAQTGSARGQAPDAARGSGRSGRANYEPTLWLPDDQFLRWPFSDPQYKKLDGFKIKRYINEITGISRKSRDDGNQYWGRIAGTPYDKMTADWVAAQYKRIGLEKIESYEFDIPPQWFPTSWEVSVTGAGKTVPMTAAFPLYASVGIEATELEPVWVG